MSNHPRVANRTKLRVIEAANRLGYVPNHAARRLVRSRLTQRKEAFDQVGFICFDKVRPRVDMPTASILCGVEQEVASYEAAVIFLRVSRESGSEKIKRLLQAGWVDGWLLEGLVQADMLALLQSPRLPCVILGGHRCRQPVHSVDVDYRAVGRLAAEHLASLGHRRVACVTGSMRHPYQWDVWNGFRTGVRELGLDDDEALFETADPRVHEPMHERLRRVLALGSRPTAIFTAEPGFAGSALEILHQASIEAPRDISLLGCELDGGYCSVPGLARVELPLGEVGRGGASLLHELVRKGAMPARQVLIVPGVVTDSSCGPLRR